MYVFYAYSKNFFDCLQGWGQLHSKIINLITISCKKPSIQLPLPLQGYYLNYNYVAHVIY